MPDLPDYTLAIVDDEELHALIRAQFEGAGDGAELPRLFAYLASRPQLQLPEALRHRAAEIIESVWDERNASPRRLLAAALLGRDDVSFRGYARYVVASAGKPDPVGVALQENTFTSQSYDVATGDWTIRDTWTSRSGYQYLPTHAPLALLAGVFHELRASRMRGEPFIPPVAVPEQRFVWERVVAEPGAGTFRATCRCWEKGQAVLDGGGRRFHIACPGCRRRARRIHLPRPGGAGTGRLRPGGAMDGLAAAIQPRHAGRALPSDVVRGGECDQRARPGAAAGGAGRVRRAPGGPVYSALALAASAKMTEQRAQAAEAIARLADVGLLDPRRSPSRSRRIWRTVSPWPGGWRRRWPTRHPSARSPAAARCRRWRRCCPGWSMPTASRWPRPPSSSSLPRACPTTMACR